MSLKKRTYKTTDMSKIDQMLNKWIFNSIIRKQLRDLIIKQQNNRYANTYNGGKNNGY